MPKNVRVEICACAKHGQIAIEGKRVFHFVSRNQGLNYLKANDAMRPEAVYAVDDSELPQKTSEVSPYVHLNFMALNHTDIPLAEMDRLGAQHNTCALAAALTGDRIMPKAFTDSLNNILNSIDAYEGIPIWP